MFVSKQYTVYIHRNKINNKCYVGITCQTVHERWRNGDGYLIKNNNGQYSQPKIARAIKKYGWDNFEHIIWAENLSHDEACHIEKLLIAIWDTINNGYNITKGGEGTVGVIRCGADNPFYGKKHNDDTKKKSVKRTKEINIGLEKNTLMKLNRS
jgi:group I intron endonuclease